MAAPKTDPDPSPEPDDFWALPPDGSANVLDEARWERMLRLPGVVVHHYDPTLAHQELRPITFVGKIEIDEFRRLLGREPYPGDGSEDLDDTEFDDVDDGQGETVIEG